VHEARTILTGVGRRIRRRVAPLAAVALVGGLLSACGSSDDSASSAPASAGPGATITHKFGTTRVPADPQRVVTVGWNDQDPVLALGVVPVATRAWFDAYDRFPWVQEATGGKGVEEMRGEGIDFEAIAAARPNVIFAIYESIDRKTYDRLAQIAPTVIQSGEYKDEETPWDVQMLTVGKALGKQREAQQLVDGVAEKIATAKREHPEFAGKVLVMDYGPEDGGHYLVGKNDPRRALFDALGFEAQDTVGDVSEEKLGLLDEDVLFVAGATRAEMITAPAFGRLGVVKDDRALCTPFDSPLAGALSYSGPAALSYALDVLVPELARAVEGRSAGDIGTAAAASR